MHWLYSLTACVTFSVLLGNLGAQAYAPYQRHLYRPEWNSAKVIAPGEEGAVAYYRHAVVLQALPVKATLQVAAPDHFELFVNGKKVGESTFVSLNTCRIFDVRPFLTTGKNIIAIKVLRSTYAGFPSLMVEGLWRDASGNTLPIASNEWWRVSAMEESQNGNQVTWTSDQFDDRHWRGVIARGDDGPPAAIEFLTVQPGLFRDFPRGLWISGGIPYMSATAFQRTFEVPGETIDDARLGIATNGAYKITVNGYFIGGRDTPSRKTMDIFDIGPYLRRGTNSVDVDVSHVELLRPRMAVGMLVTADGTTLDLSSNGEWRVIGAGPDGPQPVSAVLRQPPASDPVSSSRYYDDNLHEVLAVNPLEGQEPGKNILLAIKNAIPWVFAVAMFNGVIGSLFVLSCGRLAKINRLDSLGLYAMVNNFGSLLIACLFIIQFDIRVYGTSILNRPSFGTICLVALGLVLWTLVDVRGKRIEN